jgi:calreticulin
MSRALILTAVVASCIAIASAEVYFEEDFSGDWESRWIQSKAKSDLGTMKVSAGKYFGDEEAAKGLQTSQDAKFYAISAKTKEFSNEGKTLVVQYTVKHEQDIDCGGGYLKLGAYEPEKFEGSSEYNIMFGPDICGSSTKKTHVIFQYKGKNLDKKKEVRAESDTLSHLYTLIVKPDNTYEVQIDTNKVDSGSLEEGWDFLEPKQIRDPDEKKPEDWVDEAEIDDPEDKKPEGHDDISAKIADPKATKPDDWDDESDGTWEAPQIDNPEYKGAWKAKRIKNPAYKGVWEAKMIDNPKYAADDKLYSYPKFSTVGVDVWQVKSGTIFDNMLITDDVEYAKEHAKKTWEAAKDGEKAAKEKADEEKRKKDEEERAKKEEERKKKEEEDKAKKAAEGDKKDEEKKDEEKKEL